MKTCETCKYWKLKSEVLSKKDFEEFGDKEGHYCTQGWFTSGLCMTVDRDGARCGCYHCSGSESHLTTGMDFSITSKPTDMNEHKELAIRTLQNAKGDDTYRARAAFRGKSEKQMQEQYGQSGKTCAQIVAEYEASDAKFDAAIEWLKRV